MANPKLPYVFVRLSGGRSDEIYVCLAEDVG